MNELVEKKTENLVEILDTIYALSNHPLLYEILKKKDNNKNEEKTNNGNFVINSSVNSQFAFSNNILNLNVIDDSGNIVQGNNATLFIKNKTLVLPINIFKNYKIKVESILINKNDYFLLQSLAENILQIKLRQIPNNLDIIDIILSIDNINIYSIQLKVQTE